MTKEEAFDKIRSFKSLLPAASDEIDDILDAISEESSNKETNSKDDTTGYRPFKDAHECWNEMLRHYPFGYVKIYDERNDDNDEYYSIQSLGDYGDYRICLYNYASGKLSYDYMFDDFRFADGTPFGIKNSEK